MTNDSKTTDAVNDETPRVCSCCDEPLREDKTEHCAVCKGSMCADCRYSCENCGDILCGDLRAVERPRRLRLLRGLPV